MNEQPIDPAAITLPPTQSIDITAYIFDLDHKPAHVGSISPIGQKTPLSAGLGRTGP